MAIILDIDTSGADCATVALSVDGTRYDKHRESRIVKSQIVLPLIEEILREKNIRFDEITEIRVRSESGSFTGLRVGATVANTLGALLRIPVNGSSSLVIPVYS